MPDRDIKDLVQGYIGGQQNQDYIQRTGDWRGNASVYRTYCRAMGTMNFNHWAANGTLLGGAILGSEAMMNEGPARAGDIPAAHLVLVRRQHPGIHRPLLLLHLAQGPEGLRRLRPDAVRPHDGPEHPGQVGGRTRGARIIRR